MHLAACLVSVCVLASGSDAGTFELRTMTVEAAPWGLESRAASLCVPGALVEHEAEVPTSVEFELVITCSPATLLPDELVCMEPVAPAQDRPRMRAWRPDDDRRHARWVALASARPPWLLVRYSP